MKQKIIKLIKEQFLTFILVFILSVLVRTYIRKDVEAGTLRAIVFTLESVKNSCVEGE